MIEVQPSDLANGNHYDIRDRHLVLLLHGVLGFCSNKPLKLLVTNYKISNKILNLMS